MVHQTTNPKPAAQQGAPANPQKTPFWRKVFGLGPPRPMQERLEESLRDKWKFPDVRPHQIESLLAPENDEKLHFFLDGYYASRYLKLKKIYGLASQGRRGGVDDDDLETLLQFGQKLLSYYEMLNDESVRRDLPKYFGGYYREGKIGTETLVNIASTNWLGPFMRKQFVIYAELLHTRFNMPRQLCGPLLASVGDSRMLSNILYRKSGPEEFQRLADVISAPLPEDKRNDALVPALELLVLATKQEIPVGNVISFVHRMKLGPEHFRGFTSIVYTLWAHNHEVDIGCPVFSAYVKKVLDEFGQEIDLLKAPLFVNAYYDFKHDGEKLRIFLSPQYSETKAYVRRIGVTVPSTIWGMARVVSLAQKFDRDKVPALIRQLNEEVTLADLVFLNGICNNPDETALLLNREKLLAQVEGIKIKRIVKRRRNDQVEDLSGKIDAAYTNGFVRLIRRLSGLRDEIKAKYTEEADFKKFKNIQLLQLHILERSFDFPGLDELLGWEVSKDIHDNTREGGGYFDYDRDLALFVSVPAEQDSNRKYKASIVARSAAACAIGHFHALKIDTGIYAGPSGWRGAQTGDIDSAAEADICSVIVTTVGHPKDQGGLRDKRKVAVDIDFLFIDRENGDPLIRDRGVRNIPYFTKDQIPPVSKPSRKEKKRRRVEDAHFCPPIDLP
ncbi:MAG: hypothetical protein U0Y68_19400 [Blastocatellia bacterium]